MKGEQNTMLIFSITKTLFMQYSECPKQRV